MIDLRGYDFADFGSGFGGCLKFAKKKLGGVNGLGFEKHIGRYKDLIKKGYACINVDITKVKLPASAVNFVTMSHVLEHLNTLQEVKRVITLAINTAKNFIFIEGPSFEFDSYLRKYDLRFMWKEGHGHVANPKILDIINCAKSNGIRDYSILTERPYITGSASDDIHPLTSPPSVHKYNSKIHPQKKIIPFDEPIFRSFIIFLWCVDINKDYYLSSRCKFKECYNCVN